MSARLKAVQREGEAATASPAPFTPTVWRSEVYPNQRLMLPGVGYSIKFQGGSYTTKSQAEHDALQEIRRTRSSPVKPYTGVPVYRCGLCGFSDTDEETVNWHRQEKHSMSDVLGGA